MHYQKWLISWVEWENRGYLESLFHVLFYSKAQGPRGGKPLIFIFCVCCMHREHIHFCNMEIFIGLWKWLYKTCLFYTWGRYIVSLPVLDTFIFPSIYVVSQDGSTSGVTAPSIGTLRCCKERQSRRQIADAK